jgi:hypothetical protein
MSPITTTYLGHRIVIEPFEWGFLAQVVAPNRGQRLTAANPTALGALERAFELVDERLEDQAAAAD